MTLIKLGHENAIKDGERIVKVWALGAQRPSGEHPHAQRSQKLAGLSGNCRRATIVAWY